jgi:FkbM family methyltransferase
MDRGELTIKQLALDNPLQTIADVLRYYPQGLLGPEVTTPEGVQLILNGLSPVTIGRYRSGNAEKPEREVIDKIPDGLPTIELGAGVGYITTLLSRKTDKEVLALEPNQIAFDCLTKTKAINEAKFEPLQLAYHPTAAHVEFPTTRFFKSASLNTKTEETITVPATNLEGLFNKFDLKNCYLHVDIEGAEQDLLRHEFETLCDHSKAISIEFHRSELTETQHKIDELKQRFGASTQNEDGKHTLVGFWN